MSGSDPALEDFKARLPLAEIIGRFVKLTRRGREHVGLCPFHQERTPSFNVVEEKGFFHCFGCGAHGNAIDFVMQLEGLTFPDALNRIADLTGLEAPRRSAQAAAQAEAGQRLHAANAAAAVWFQAQLAAASGREAMGYLERRGLDRATIRTFELGYAPQDGQALRTALRAQGFSDTELVAAGLIRPDEVRGPYAHFRHRLMFPITDERGRTVGFGGRALGEARAKYLNTPETEIFRKGELLYNLHRARGPGRERRDLILAEGYMDVIALSQAGLAHAVAPLGTAVTERQLATLWRIAEAPTVCLDGDRAGLAAALRAAERALPVMRAGQTLRFAVLPDGEDPDSYLRRHGADALAAVLSKAHTLSQMIWRLETQGRRFDTPEERAALSRRLRALARLAGDPDLRESLQDQFNVLLAEHAPRRGRAVRGPVRNAASPWDGVGPSRLVAGIARREKEREAAILLPLLRRPDWLEGHEEELAHLQFRDHGLERLRQEIVAWFSEAASLDADALARHLHHYGLERDLDQFADHLTQQLADPAADAEARRQWCEMLAAMRHRSALEQERSTVDGVSSGDGGHLNRWFYRLDRLLNRDGAGEADHDEGSGTPPG